MSASVVPENVFLSALQPSSSVTTYAVPSDIQLGHGGTMSDEMARVKRVQQQVSMRLAEKSSTTLPRQNGSVSQYASSDYGGSATMKYQTFNPGFSSKSYVYTATRPMMAQRSSQYSSGYSSRSAADMAPRTKMSIGAGGGGSMYYRDDGMGMAGGRMQQMAAVTHTMSRPPPDLETMSLQSMRIHAMPQQPAPMATWLAQEGRDGSEGSLASERDATYQRQAFSVANGYTASTYPRQSMYVSSNGYSGGQSRQAASATLPSMRRSLSGSLARGGGGGMVQEEVSTRQYSFKGPAHRTISRINNRQQQNRMSTMSTGSMSGDGGFLMHGGSQSNLAMMQQSRQGNLSRAMSLKSVHSVGRGNDVFDGMDMNGSMGNLSGINSLDMPTAVGQLSMPDAEMQVLGAAYIQHECYHDSNAKKMVKQLNGIPLLVQLFNSENQEVQRYATGAARNVIYENMENKVALIEAGGIPQLMEALKEQDDELRKNVTGILWNLSSKDNLKEKLARETLPELTERILIPLSGLGNPDMIEQSASEADIFLNTTGCLRNLSSVNDKTRQHMRETNGLVDALVTYVKSCLDDNSTKIEEKGVENSMCVLRNLSYQLYSEIPPSVQMRLDGPSRNQSVSTAEAMGCFTPKSKKTKDSQCQDLSTFTEVARVPKGMEWLWHPQVVGLYNRVLQRCEINSTTREAAAGALQNITAGDKRWASVLSRVVLEQERMLPTILDNFRSNNDLEMRSLTGLVRNLSKHSRNKNDMATKVVNILVTKLPDDGQQKEPSTDVVLNICGALNNLVTSSEVAARDITFFDGLPKLIGIKTSHDSSPLKLKAARAAATVLCNMFQYKKLHKEYKKKGYSRQDFADMTI
ncbi:plakophilin-3a [Chanos chanos]|uniref:Plakophilin-3a n=1 Tax=Chanos chanos TaxID=29144 RepID=A0A6J2WRF0_CHACN|nr:plakophilin-3-like [Chanos chanos]